MVDPSTERPDPVARRVWFRASGTVQGVGFRPSVHRWAHDLGVSGWVANEGPTLVGEAQGTPSAVAVLLERIAKGPSALARVAELEVHDLPPDPAVRTDGAGRAPRFEIVHRSPHPTTGIAIPADRATCSACLADVADPSDRHHRYPFTSCADCGPRLTIVRSAPYDRARTTMAPFTRCRACETDYRDPANRRFGAEATCCAACGPTLRFVAPDGRVPAGDPIETAAEVVRGGGVVSVKGLGGHHLCARADDAEAVSRVRRLKGREHKPLAVLVADLAAAGSLVHLNAQAAAALAGDRAPIVLVPRRPAAPVAPGVAPETDLLGVALPPTALHHLLVRAIGTAVVLTSANPSDEPMLIDDAEVIGRLGPNLDGCLVHDRAIATRVDDSVVRVVGATTRFVRRARGWAPEPIPLRRPVARPVVAVGADLKSTVCVAVEDRAWVSTHLGDLGHPAARDAHREALHQLIDAVGVQPSVVAHDLHPGYVSTAVAHDLATELDVEPVAVAHHHAHALACLAEHGHRGPALAVTYDGLGYGPDGTAWGGELLLVTDHRWERLDHLALVAMPGGAAAIREGWRMTAAHLASAGLPPEGLAVHDRHRHEWALVARVARGPASLAPPTSSVGRWFDAVAALCDERDSNRYEGDAASALEQLAERTRPPRTAIGGTSREIMARLVDRRRNGADPGEVAAAFHDELVALTAEGVARAAAATGIDVVAFGGGVFANARLLRALEDRLRADGLVVLSPTALPANDGGISVGQAVAASFGRWTFGPTRGEAVRPR
jgi:hydrogenase maturation protein HypF